MTRNFVYKQNGLAAAIALAIGTGASPVQAADALEEVVVTGLRRESSLIDAPVSVNVFNAEQIRDAQIERPTDFAALTPGVTMVQSNIPGEAYVTIRGNTQNRLGESSVALVIDGVQSIDQNNINQELFDIESIEILKGPQGALYGRNAIGGAIVINTKKPGDEWEGKVRAGYGNGDEKLIQGTVSGPLIANTLGMTAGVSYLDRDGFWDNDITGEDVDRFEDLTGFLRVMWTPNDRFTADFKVNRVEMEGGGINWNALISGIPGLNTSPVFSGDVTNIPFQNNIGGFSENDRTNASLKLDYESDFGTFTVVGAYALVRDFYGSDSYPYFNDPGLFNTFFPPGSVIGLGAQTQNTTRESEIMTVDARFSSPSENRFRWTVGAFYGDFEIVNRNITGADTDNVLLAGDVPHPFGSTNQTLGFLADTQNNDAWAVYFSADFDFTDKLTGTVSLRYDKENKSQVDEAFPNAPAPGETRLNLNPGCADPAVPCLIPTWSKQEWRSRDASFDEFQPKFTLSYQLADNATTFASWGRGFKTGGFNPFGAGALISFFNPATTVGDVFDKEVAETFEVGLKMDLMDGRLKMNMGAFYTETENAQLLEFFPASTLQAVSTAEAVDMYGGEVDVTFYPDAIPGLMLYGGFGLLITEITEFSANPAFEGGDRPSTSPITANLAANYERELPFMGGSEGFVRLDWSFQGETEWDWANTPGAARSGIDLLNARFGVRQDKWEVAFVGKNLTNNIYNSEHIVLIPAAGVGALFRAQPRSYGGEFIYRF